VLRCKPTGILRSPGAKCLRIVRPLRCRQEHPAAPESTVWRNHPAGSIVIDVKNVTHLDAQGPARVSSRQAA